MILYRGISIFVICDGGWSKIRHKYSYNAMGGVGVITSAKTKHYSIWE